MPEYSSTTITPADGVKTPAMNGSTSGNYTLSALRDFILASKGQANGIASLGADGKLTSSQLPDLADDVLVYASYATLPATGTASKIYITADNNKMYRWDPDLATPDYVELSVDLSAYATKTELVAEESARESADSHLKDAIDRNSNRITNLEQEHGGYVPVNYRGTNAVPTNKAKYALVESIVGKSRAWNNTCQGVINTTTVNGVTFTNNSDGSLTLSGTASANITEEIFTIYITFPKDHVTLCAGLVEKTGIFYGVRGFNINNPSNFFFTYSSNWYHGLSIKIASGTNTNGITLKPFTRDVSLIFPELTTAQIQSLGIAGLVAICPDLLKYDSFGSSIVNTTVEGVKSVGFNRLDLASYMQTLGISKSGDYYVTSAYEFANKSATTPIPIDWQYGTRYSFRMTGMVHGSLTSFRINVTYTDGTSENLALIASSSLATGAGTSADGKTIAKATFSYGSGSSSNFSLKSITVSIGTDTTKDADYMTDTLSLPSSVILRSAGTGFEDVLDVETGEITSKCVEYTITGEESFTFYTSSDASLGNHYGVVFPIPPALSDIRTVLDAVGINDIGLTLQYANNDKTIYVSPSNIIMINDAWTTEATFVTNITGKHLVFALQDFGSTTISPVIDNTILTEGGGTINTIQTQTPVIDNCMDVGYLAL